ncbi:MAG: SDR family NAD(P)-dependent oxidoreductase [Pseudomonadota bacterium]
MTDTQTSGDTRARSILITGCSSGIGLACARGMRDRGWMVMATARTDDDLAMLKEESLNPIHLELRSPESIARCVATALERTDGRLDALFNNAAYGQPGAVEDLTPDVLRAQFETNVFSWHDLTCRIVPSMRANGHGRIVQCSSVLGFISPPWRGAYNASKHALEALSNAMRHELEGSGIQVISIQPGPIESRFVPNALDAVRANVDLENTPHRETYAARLESMKAGGSTRFKLGPEAVLEKLVLAVESPNPRLTYKVTWPTHFAAWAQRLLPERLAHRFIANA